MSAANPFSGDIREYEHNLKWRRWKRIITVVVFLYFAGLFALAMAISRQEVTFFTDTYGYETFRPLQTVMMSFQAYDIKKVNAIDEFRVQVKLNDPVRKQVWTVIDAQSMGRVPLVDSFTVPEALPEGRYTLEVTYTTPLGVETSPVGIEVKKNIRNLKVAISPVDKDKLAKPEPLQIKDFGEPNFSLELLPENGRVAAGMDQTFFIIARQWGGDPMPDLRVQVYSFDGKSLIADVLTDAAGLASFPHKTPLDMGSLRLNIVKSDAATVQKLRGLTAEQDKVRSTEKKGKHRTQKLKALAWPAPDAKKDQVVSQTYELGPIGANIHVRPVSVVQSLEEPVVATEILTLMPKVPYYINTYRYGQWISHWEKKPDSMKIKLALPLPPRTPGILHFQASDSMIQVGDRYDAFMVYFTKIQDPFKQLEALHNLMAKKSRNFDEHGLAAWQGLVDKVLAGERKDYDPHLLMRVGFSMIAKPYYMPPLLYKSRTDKIAAHGALMQERKDKLVTVMGFSGAAVLLVVLAMIIREFARRRKSLEQLQLEAGESELSQEDMEAMRPPKNKLVSLVVGFLLLVLVYAFMLYFVTHLNWNLTMPVIQ